MVAHLIIEEVERRPVQFSQLQMGTGLRGAVDDRDEIRKGEVVRHLLLARHAHDGTVITQDAAPTPTPPFQPP